MPYGSGVAVSRLSRLRCNKHQFIVSVLNKDKTNGTARKYITGRPQERRPYIFHLPTFVDRRISPVDRKGRANESAAEINKINKTINKPLPWIDDGSGGGGGGGGRGGGGGGNGGGGGRRRGTLGT